MIAPQAAELQNYFGLAAGSSFLTNTPNGVGGLSLLQLGEFGRGKPVTCVPPTEPVRLRRCVRLRRPSWVAGGSWSTPELPESGSSGVPALSSVREPVQAVAVGPHRVVGLSVPGKRGRGQPSRR
jgi:hypothetical protein